MHTRALNGLDDEMQLLDWKKFFHTLARDIDWLETSWSNVADLCDNYKPYQQPPLHLDTYIDSLSSTQSINFILLLFYSVLRKHKRPHAFIISKLQSSWNIYHDILVKLIPQFFSTATIDVSCLEQLLSTHTLPFIRDECLQTFFFHLILPTVLSTRVFLTIPIVPRTHHPGSASSLSHSPSETTISATESKSKHKIVRFRSTLASTSYPILVWLSFFTFTLYRLISVHDIIHPSISKGKVALLFYLFFLY